jgi:hypothetical protein
MLTSLAFPGELTGKENSSPAFDVVQPMKFAWQPCVPVIMGKSTPTLITRKRLKSGNLSQHDDSGNTQNIGSCVRLEWASSCFGEVDFWLMLLDGISRNPRL